MTSLAVTGRSELVVRQMKGEWKVRSPRLRSLYARALDLCSCSALGTVTFQPFIKEKMADARGGLLEARRLAEAGLKERAPHPLLSVAAPAPAVEPPCAGPGLAFLAGAQAPAPAAGERWVLHFDGGARPNPGHAGAGAILHRPDGTEAWRTSAYVGHRATNNEAEYVGLIMGLDKAVELHVDALDVYGDSALVVNQVQGRWKVSSPNLQALRAKAVAFAELVPGIQFHHVPRAENAEADALATLGLGLDGVPYQLPTLRPQPPVQGKRHDRGADGDGAALPTTPPHELHKRPKTEVHR